MEEQLSSTTNEAKIEANEGCEELHHHSTSLHLPREPSSLVLVLRSLLIVLRTPERKATSRLGTPHPIPQANRSLPSFSHAPSYIRNPCADPVDTPVAQTTGQGCRDRHAWRGASDGRSFSEACHATAASSDPDNRHLTTASRVPLSTSPSSLLPPLKGRQELTCSRLLQTRP